MPLELARPVSIPTLSLLRADPMSLPTEGKLPTDPLLPVLSFDGKLTAGDLMTTGSRLSPELNGSGNTTPPPVAVDHLTVVASTDYPRFIPDEELLLKSMRQDDLTGDEIITATVPTPEEDLASSELSSQFQARLEEFRAFNSAHLPTLGIDQVSARLPKPWPVDGQDTHDPLHNLQDVIARYEQILLTSGHSPTGGCVDPWMLPSGVTGSELSIAVMLEAQAMQARLAEAMRSFSNAMEHGNVTVNIVGTPVHVGPFATDEMMHPNLL